LVFQQEIYMSSIAASKGDQRVVGWTWRFAACSLAAVLSSFIVGSDAHAQQYPLYSQAPGWSLGVLAREYTYTDPNWGSVTGLYIYTVIPTGPAHRAGFEVGDFITGVNGVRVETREEFVDALNESGGRAWFRIRNIRNGRYQNTPVICLGHDPL
jgi:predicted metalloprotease with PDZ domain